MCRLLTQAAELFEISVLCATGATSLDAAGTEGIRIRMCSTAVPARLEHIQFGMIVKHVAGDCWNCRR